jgi:hypothetical protein
MAVTIPGSGNVVIQVVNATYNTAVNSTTSAYATTGLTATITPKFATSKILVLVSQSGLGKNAASTYIGLQLLRGATLLAQIEGQATFNGAAQQNTQSSSTSYLDSPATASAVTYSTQFNNVSNTGIVTVQSTSSTSTITLLEISGS